MSLWLRRICGPLLSVLASCSAYSHFSKSHTFTEDVMWPLLSVLSGLMISERAWRTRPKGRSSKSNPLKSKGN